MWDPDARQQDEQSSAVWLGGAGDDRGQGQAGDRNQTRRQDGGDERTGKLDVRQTNRETSRQAGVVGDGMQVSSEMELKRINEMKAGG